MESVAHQPPPVQSIAQRRRVRRQKPRLPSRITIPDPAHSLVKLVFGQMKKQGVGYSDLEWAAGIQITTIKAWRTGRPGIESIEAALGALGWGLVPVPNYEMLPANERAAVDGLTTSLSKSELFAAAVLAASELPARAARDRAERLVPPKSRMEPPR